MLVCKIASRACFSQSVIINYQDLKAGKNLQSAIETAYGPKGIPSVMQVMAYCLLTISPIL